MSAPISPRVAGMHDTGKVVIGIANIPRYQYVPSRCALTLQQAMLDKRTAQPLPLINRVLAPVWRWL